MEQIEHVVYINLNHRTDRNELVMNELMKYFSKNKITRFSAIKEINGAIGCSKSHVEVMKMAIKKDWKNVLIVEDDMMWNDKSGFAKLETFIKEPYDVILLGGAWPKWNNQGKLISSYTTTSYLVSNHYYKTLLENYETSLKHFIETNDESKYAIDVFWFKLQEPDNWKLIKPSLCVQRPIYSDIRKKHVDLTPHFC